MRLKFEIQYKPDKENKVADALSRSEAPIELSSYFLWQLSNWEEWEQQIKLDLKLATIIQLSAIGQQMVHG